MTRPATLLLLGAIAGAFLATVLGAWLVFWRSGAEPETRHKFPSAWHDDWNDPAMDVYDGEPVGV